MKFDNTLFAALIVLGVGLMISVFLQVKYGLLPLNKIKHSLFKIRNGDEKKLKDPYPMEVQPLATEINDLLEHNEKIVEIQQQASLMFEKLRKGEKIEPLKD